MSDKETKIWTYDELSSPHIWLMRIATFLPLENRTFEYTGTWLLSIYYHTVMLIYSSMYLWSGIWMITHPDEEFDLAIICEVFVVESISIKYLLVFTSRRQLAKLMDTCRRLWQYISPEESVIVKPFENKAYIVRNIFLVNATGVSVAYILTAFFVKLPPLEPNGTERRILPFRFYFKVEEDPMFSIVAGLQSIVCFTVSLSVMPAIENTSLFTIMMACGYLRCIDQRLRAMKDQADMGRRTLSKRDIVDCLIFHQQVIKYCEDIEKFTRSIFMTTVMSILYVLSLIMVKLLQGDSSAFSLMIVFALHSVSLFICQWGPQQLTNESENVGDAAYCATLEHLDFTRDANDMLSVMMMRAQKPIELTAGGYIRLSMETFKSMATSAMSFFTVLRSFN